MFLEIRCFEKWFQTKPIVLNQEVIGWYVKYVILSIII